MSIELIAIDLDGTLLNNEKKINLKVKNTLAKAKEKGIKVVICTGRPLPGVVDYLKELNLEEAGDYVITYNGALVQKAHDGTTIAHHTMSFEDFLEVEAMSQKMNVHCQTLDEKSIYTTNKDISPFTVRESSLVHMPIKYRSVEEMDPNLIISKMMMIDEPNVLDAGITQIPSTFYEKYTVLRSEPFYLEVLNKAASKGQALKDLADILSLPRESIMALGDNENDRDMIVFAGIGVAMGNATKEIKAISDYVTDTNELDGVATVIEKLVFNQ